MRIRITVVALLAITFQLVPGSATAHDVTQGQRTAGNGVFCVYDDALLRENDKDDGYARGQVRTYRGNCSTPVNRDVEFLSVSLRVWFSTTVNGSQRLCVYTNWYYNTQPAWGWGLQLTFPDRPYCGPGWYEVETAGYLWWDGAWRGGRVFSGRHLLN